MDDEVAVDDPTVRLPSQMFGNFERRGGGPEGDN
jgi:hypothetical protein